MTKRNEVVRQRWPGMQRLSRNVLLGVCCGLGIAAGCGRGEPVRVATYPARGTISFDGKPIPGAFIALHPRASSDPAVPCATAHVKEDGTFQLSTFQTGDGVPAGEYVLIAQWHKLVATNGEFAPGPNVLPQRYSNPKSSDIVIRIDEAPTEFVVQLKRSSSR